MPMTLALPPATDPARGGATPAARRARRTLLLLAIVCVLPVFASYFAFYVWQPQGRVNHGALLSPTALPQTVLAGAAGQPALSRGEFERQWTLLVAAPAACDAACVRALYVTRQARLAQAKDMERVGRVWLLTDGAQPSADILNGQDGLRVARADSTWLAVLAGADAGTAQVFLVDPLGNVMMRFADDADTTRAARGVTKDLQRLLKYSALGRGGRE